ncbi:roadblock/LC7 domain-containing protein [Amycolatopsis sp. OK19-0408]|uniref:Roadblock/LC7 domain-containing protein n=1 Tax=Amycolatopsis iheyensis TaxID=2945988 RepID=A0A9X2SPM6_9PSEU|nr:roadblock/LC7 domain-containing protein [Amycolatopsis iheyensis]MCR6488336.1 roadblock/LC7 domain-containing protein [Amycolatopsis iheyensis]
MTSDEDRWKLAELTRIPGVRFCLVFAVDGILLTNTADIDEDGAQRIAAACSGLLSLATALNKDIGFQSPLLQNFSRWSDGYVFVRRAADKTSLAVVTSETADPSLIAHAMAERIQRIGESALSTPGRAPAGA